MPINKKINGALFLQFFKKMIIKNRYTGTRFHFNRF